MEEFLNDVRKSLNTIQAFHDQKEHSLAAEAFQIMAAAFLLEARKQKQLEQQKKTEDDLKQ